MRTTILGIRRNCLAFLHGRRYATEPPRVDAHMNELPVPCEPWEPWYKKKQRIYTIQLACGALWWLFSLGMVIYTESIFLNWSPPKQPGPPSDMIDECEDADA